MKKILLGTFLGIFALVGITVLPNYTLADENDGGNGGGTQPTETTTTFNWGANGSGNDDRSYDKVKGSGDSNLISNTGSTGSSLLDTIKSTIKWILGILATVAVVICLYAGFVMMTSAGDENKYKNGMKILKYAAIGLAIILLSWLIVSVIFWFINQQGAKGVM